MQHPGTLAGLISSPLIHHNMKNLQIIASIARAAQEDLPAKMQIDNLEEKILAMVWVHENDAIQYFYRKCDELGLSYN